jgi:spermidine synthase
VATALAEAAPASYDVVLLDVDNGPDHLVHGHNAALYRDPFLETVRDRLTPGGVLVIWSALQSPDLLRGLRSAFGGAEERPHDVRLQDRDEHYWLYVGRRTERVSG